MPRAVIEGGGATHVVRPAGRQHEEIEILLLKREITLRQSWYPPRLVRWVIFEQCDYAR